MKTREAMTRLVDIEQAVEAVRAMVWADPHDPGKREMISRADVEDALRALPPAEATEEEMERMADAIYRCDGSSYCFGANDEDEREPYMAKARAAWAALVGEIK